MNNLKVKYQNKIWLRGNLLSEGEHETHYKCFTEPRFCDDKYFEGTWIEINHEFSEVVDISLNGTI